jgi:ubiquinone/menaquinone biosynthesis C-methylase UbiE
LQERGFDVTGIDNSPGAIKVCKARGLKKALVRSIEDISKFRTSSFDTVMMMANNFGLLSSPEEGRPLLREMFRITSVDARIIANSMNPYGTSKPEHLKYHKFNRQRGRMPGQIRFRIRFGTAISDWFDYLLVTPEEMGTILKGTGWHIKKILGDAGHRYFAVIEKDLRS